MSGKDLIKARTTFLYDTVDPDVIVDMYDCRDFTEFITRTGGDVCRYRVYGMSPMSFTLCEK